MNYHYKGKFYCKIITFTCLVKLYTLRPFCIEGLFCYITMQIILSAIKKYFYHEVCCGQAGICQKRRRITARSDISEPVAVSDVALVNPVVKVILYRLENVFKILLSDSAVRIHALVELPDARRHLLDCVRG